MEGLEKGPGKKRPGGPGGVEGSGGHGGPGGPGGPGRLLKACVAMKPIIPQQRRRLWGLQSVKQRRGDWGVRVTCSR